MPNQKADKTSTQLTQWLTHPNSTFLILTVLLILLIAKNPYSNKNTISNLEPFPDALIYLTTTKNLTEGQGLKISYHQIQLDATIPPLYPITLAPLYWLFQDPRSLYFTNISLLLISSIFFYKILLKLFSNSLIIALTYFAFITNSIILWYPTVAMAENLLICLFIISTYLLISPIKSQKSVLLGLLVTGFFATKYTGWTISFSLSISYLILLFTQKITLDKKIRQLLVFTASLLSSFLILAIIEASAKQQDFLSLISSYPHYLYPIFTYLFNLGSSHAPATAQNGSSFSYFSSAYLGTNLLRYFAGLIGGPAPIANKDFSTIPIIIGMSSLVALFINPFFRNQKILNLYFLLTFLTTLVFISFFYSTDMRYLLIIIPIQILTFSIFLNRILIILASKKLFLAYLATIIICTLGVVISTVPDLKYHLFDNSSQIPKNYKTVEFYNQNFKNSSENKPYIISILPPLFVDFFSNKNFNLLPFSRSQHFMYKPEIWGISEQGNLLPLYRLYLDQGKLLYLSDYNIDSFFNTFTYDAYKQNFTLTQISSGCQNHCHLFRLESKK